MEILASWNILLFFQLLLRSMQMFGTVHMYVKSVAPRVLESSESQVEIEGS